MVLATVIVAIGIVALFLLPLRHQIAEILTDLPGTVRDAARGRGALGPLVRKLHLQKTVQDHEKTLHDWAANINKSSLSYLATVGEATIGVITVVVIAFFMLAETKNIANVATALITPARRELARQIGHDAASAISGYMIGNLLISLVAGTAAFLMFLIMGVPNAAALGAWIAFTDLIPLVGATIGAVAGVIAAFFHGNVAGIVSIVFFVVYQQFENSVLAPLVMHRTTRISPLTVLISVLVGVELVGYWGAVFAIPIAASLKVLAGRGMAGDPRRPRHHRPRRRREHPSRRRVLIAALVYGCASVTVPTAPLTLRLPVPLSQLRCELPPHMGLADARG